MSEASGKGGEIRALLQQKAVDGTWSEIPVAGAQELAVGVSIILERKPDAGKPHVRFDERGYGNVVMVEIETLTKGESGQIQLSPQPNAKRARPRLHKSSAPLLDPTFENSKRKTLHNFIEYTVLGRYHLNY